MIPSRIEGLYREILIVYRAITNHMKFNKDKCWILHLQRCNPACTYGPGDMTGAQARRKGSGGLGWLLAQYEPTVCAGSQKGRPHPGAR